MRSLFVTPSSSAFTLALAAILALGHGASSLSPGSPSENENEKAIELVEKAIRIVAALEKQKSLRDSEKGLLAELEEEKAKYKK